MCVCVCVCVASSQGCECKQLGGKVTWSPGRFRWNKPR